MKGGFHMEQMISNVSVLYGDNLELLNESAVWVENGVIKQVLPCRQIPQDITVVDGHGMFLLPGLIDLHVHIMWDGSVDPVKTMDAEGHDQMVIRAVANCQTQLKSGVTTLRDLGSVDNIALQVAKSIDSGVFQGPRVVASGKTLTITGGHDPFWARFCDGPLEALKGVREQIYKNAQVIKVSATGGVYGRSKGETIDSQFSYEELKIICDEAHRFGVKVASHAIAREGILNSILARVDTIEHGHFLDDELIEIMEEKSVAWIPTLFVYQQIATMDNIPSYAREKAQNLIERHVAAFQKYFGRNMLIGAGSDAGSPLTPHPSILDELLTMHRFVSNTKAILKTATVNAGRILGQQIGQIKEGYAADFILCKENPLVNLSYLRNVQGIYIGGKLV